MTKKDYILIADVIKSVELSPVYAQSQCSPAIAAFRRELAENFARMLSRDNGRFDRDRFLQACGVAS